MYTKITDEMKQRCRNIDLVDYLESRGMKVKKTGDTYKLEISRKYPGDLSSLSIYPDRKGWKRWSNGVSGSDVISFLQKVENMSYQESVEEILHTHKRSFSTSASPVPLISCDNTEKELELPERFNGKYSRVVAYLNKTRGIDAHIISELMKNNMVYQDESNNVVFVGFDDNKKAKFGCVRGTMTDKQYRRDCSGSDKRYCFFMPGILKSKVFVFESPIDAMSHASLTNKVINRDDAWKVYNRLALCGTADVALEHYIDTHPDIKEINLCLDNDEAGRTASAEIRKKYEQLGFTVKERFSHSKDYNDDLLEYIKNKKEITDEIASPRHSSSR